MKENKEFNIDDLAGEFFDKHFGDRIFEHLTEEEVLWALNHFGHQLIYKENERKNNENRK